ncbi:tetraspanin-32 [Spea bombifrons]|uniref:tetraspanin-32 n=1 Tax=Spea bombifrons TaxID=233779 RepID=UPI00234BE459|nr:tetraspanin-32 [Spea bombifrons]
MGQKLWVRVSKCQLLIICLFMMLLALAGCFMTAITGSGSHFAILTKCAPAENPLRGVHLAMVVYGGSTCSFLFLNILLSSLSVLRESQRLMAITFLVFGCLFCALMAGVTWTHESQEEVESLFLDVYDGLYDQVLQESHEGRREDLLSIHENFHCCGKIGSWNQGVLQARHLCESMTETLDCVLVISAAINSHWQWITNILLLTLGFTVYGMILSSFLCFSFQRATSWDRRGKYNLNDAMNWPQGQTADTPLTQLLPSQHAK